MRNGQSSALLCPSGLVRGSLTAKQLWYDRDDLFPQESKRSRNPLPSQSAGVSQTSIACALALAAAFAVEGPIATELSFKESIAPPQYVSEARLPIKRATSAISLIDQWLQDDSGYDEAAWPNLQRALEEDRLSDRRLFDA